MLNGKNIYIRLTEKEDLNLKVKWINDEEIRKTLMFDWPLSYAGTKKWFEQQLLDNSRKNFVIVYKESQKIIGITGLRNINIRHSRAQFYITIGEKNFWGKHIPDEVMPLVLEYGFFELGLNKIYLYTIPNNERARKVYIRNGFIHEGILRIHFFCNGNYQDSWVMSILKCEYRENK